jgi:hypothetical protein
MAEAAIPRYLFADILRLTREFRPPPVGASLISETLDEIVTCTSLDLGNSRKATRRDACHGNEPWNLGGSCRSGRCRASTGRPFRPLRPHLPLARLSLGQRRPRPRRRPLRTAIKSPPPRLPRNLRTSSHQLRPLSPLLFPRLRRPKRRPRLRRRLPPLPLRAKTRRLPRRARRLPLQRVRKRPQLRPLPPQFGRLPAPPVRRLPTRQLRPRLPLRLLLLRPRLCRLPPRPPTRPPGRNPLQRPRPAKSRRA